MLVHCAHGQEHGDRRAHCVGLAIAEHEDPRSLLDRVSCCPAQGLERAAQPVGPAGGAPECRDGHSARASSDASPPQCRHLVFEHDRVLLPAESPPPPTPPAPPAPPPRPPPPAAAP